MQNYLQQILSESNTIIIPGFGALTITSNKTGEIYFMPFLKHDDGILAKHIANTEAITLDEAKTTIANFVNTVKSSIDNGENFEMTEFGRFSLNSQGEIEFQRWDDFQSKDNSILAKKIKEQKNTKDKQKNVATENVSLEQSSNDIVSAEPKEEPVKSDAEIHQQIEEELPLSTNPFHLTLNETEIHPIKEQTTSQEEQLSMEKVEETTDEENESIESTITTIENKTINNEYVTLINEPMEENINVSIELVENTENIQEKEINTQIEPITENAPHSSNETKEKKKTLQKKQKNEKEVEEVKEEIKPVKKAKKTKKTDKLPDSDKHDKSENEVIEIITPKEKKKSRSMIFWLFSAILLTISTMWFIKKQRDSKVHLTVIDKKESKVITNKVIEKKELHKEISKHTQKEIEEKENTPTVKNDISTKKSELVTPKIESTSNVVTTDVKSTISPKTNPKLTNTITTTKLDNSATQNTKTITPPPPAKISPVIVSSTPIIPPVPAPKKISKPDPNPAYTSPNKNIQVIVGTFKDKASAEQLLSNLKTDGFNSAFSKEMNGTYQVSLGSFTTLSESNKALQKYRGVK